MLMRNYWSDFQEVSAISRICYGRLSNSVYNVFFPDFPIFSGNMEGEHYPEMNLTNLWNKSKHYFHISADNRVFFRRNVQKLKF